jgi:hypothetical protein
MGNADWYVLTGESAEPGRSGIDRPVDAGALGDDIAFMRLPTHGRAARSARIHGSPASFDELIFPSTPEDDFRRLLTAGAALLAGGHVHLPCGVVVLLFVNLAASGSAERASRNDPRLDF